MESADEKSKNRKSSFVKCVSGETNGVVVFRAARLTGMPPWGKIPVHEVMIEVPWPGGDRGDFLSRTSAESETRRDSRRSAAHSAQKPRNPFADLRIFPELGLGCMDPNADGRFPAAPGVDPPP